MLSETLVIGLLPVTTAIAVAVASKRKKGISKSFFSVSAMFSWGLLFFYLFFLPQTVILSTPNPLTAEGIQALLLFIIILFEIFGFYYWMRGD